MVESQRPPLRARSRLPKHDRLQHDGQPSSVRPILLGPAGPGSSSPTGTAAAAATDGVEITRPLRPGRAGAGVVYSARGWSKYKQQRVLVSQREIRKVCSQLSTSSAYSETALYTLKHKVQEAACPTDPTVILRSL